MPQPPPNLPLLQLSPRHLLLFLRLELQLPTVFSSRVHSRRSRARHNAATGSARDATASAGVIFEAVEGDGCVALVGHTAVRNVPLFRAEGTDEFFVVRNHDDTTLVVADGNSETSK